MNNIQSMSLEKLFKQLGYNYESIEQDNFVDISNRNVKIKCFDHNKKEIVVRKILKLVRKNDEYVYHLVNRANEIILKATGGHRIFDPVRDRYVSIHEFERITVQTSDNNYLELKTVFANYKSPILDIEVEELNNYFSNNILSHNTGGNALKFYASQRIDIRTIGKDKLGEEITGQFTRVKVVKNKVATPFKTAEFALRNGRGIDKYADLVNVATSKNVMTKSGSWYSYGDEKIGQGESTAIEWLKSNPVQFDKIYAELTGSN